MQRTARNPAYPGGLARLEADPRLARLSSVLPGPTDIRRRLLQDRRVFRTLRPTRGIRETAQARSARMGVPHSCHRWLGKDHVPALAGIACAGAATHTVRAHR